MRLRASGLVSLSLFGGWGLGFVELLAFGFGWVHGSESGECRALLA